MRYLVHHPGGSKKSSTVITCDGKVVWTTEALHFWIGWSFAKMMASYTKHRPGARWEMVGPEFEHPGEGKLPWL